MSIVVGELAKKDWTSHALMKINLFCYMVGMHVNLVKLNSQSEFLELNPPIAIAERKVNTAQKLIDGKVTYNAWSFCIGEWALVSDDRVLANLFFSSSLPPNYQQNAHSQCYKYIKRWVHWRISFFCFFSCSAGVGSAAAAAVHLSWNSSQLCVCFFLLFAAIILYCAVIHLIYIQIYKIQPF